jgi:hypothetical protein
MNDIILFVLTVILVVLIVRIVKDNRTHLLLKLILCISFTWWYLTPYLLTTRNFLWFATSSKENYIIYQQYFIYNAFYWMALLVIYQLLNKRFKKVPKLFMFNSHDQLDKQFLNYVFWISLPLCIMGIVNIFMANNSYLFNNDIGNSTGHRGLINFFSRYSFWAIEYLIIFHYRTFEKRKFVVIITIISLLTLLQILSGGRIALMLPLIIIFYLFIQTKKPVYMYVSIVLFIFALIISPIIANLRSSSTGLIDVNLIVNDIKKQDVGGWQIINELVLKTNSVYYGTVLLEKEGIGSGGKAVYINTIEANMPIKDRPIPMSKDGTYSGTIARVAGNAGYSTENAFINVGVPTSLESLWTMGFLSYFLSMLVSGLFLWVVNVWIKTENLFPVMFAMDLLIFPNCMADISPLLILRDLPRFFIVYLFILIPYKLFAIKKRFAKF